MNGNAWFGVRLCVMVVLLFCFTIRPAAAQTSGDDGTVASLTNDLLKEIKTLSGRQGKQSTKAKDIIAKRKTKLLSLLEKNPETARSLMLPQNLIDSFPEDIKALLENNVTLEGDLSIIMTHNFDMDVTETHYFLTDSVTNKRHRLFDVPDAANLRTNHRVRVNGFKIDDNLLTSNLTIAAIGGKTTKNKTPSAAAASPMVSGNQKTIVLIVDFDNASAGCSVEDLQSRVFTSTTSVNEYFQEVSFDNVSLSGDVRGPFRIPYSTSESCGSLYYDWADAADRAATNSGINLNNYTRKVYMMPAACGYGGLGTVGGNPSRSWIFYCGYNNIIAHEIGHNLGMNHASSMSSTGAISEYGDGTDTMGSGNNTHVNAPHKIEMGWVPANNVQTVSSSGTYVIKNLNSYISGIQALKISKPDTGESYYLSYRQRSGFDGNLSAYDADRTSVHKWAGSGNKTFLLTSLGDGMSFTDSVNGITVTQVSHDNSQAVLSVNFRTPDCARSNPSVSISSASQNAPAGTQISYMATIKNQNNSYCAPATYQVTGSTPDGWTNTWSSPQITLNSGASGTVTWRVTSPVTAADGNYELSFRVTDINNAVYSALLKATLVIFKNNTGPTVNILNPVEGSSVSGKIKISVSASDPVGIKSISFYIDGKFKYTDMISPYEYNWSTTLEKPGSHNISAKATNKSGETALSPTVTVNLTTSKERR